MEIKTMKVKLSDILEAFELNDRYSEDFLDKETGEDVQVNKSAEMCWGGRL